MAVVQEEEIHYTPRGKEVKREIDLQRASSYGLAKALLYFSFDKKGRETVGDSLFSRFGRIIDYSFAVARISDKKPDKEQKREYAKRLDTFKTILRSNFERVTSRVMDKEAKCSPDLEYSDPETSYDERVANKLIFSLRMKNAIMFLSSSPGIDKVVDDYLLVGEVNANTQRFGELEQLCRGALNRFMTAQRIRYIPEEDQMQEGRLAIWRAAQSYKAKNFARFSTLVKTCLTNKFNDLITFHIADKRRIHKFTSPAGSATNAKESYLARLIDGQSHEIWTHVQAAQMNGNNGRDYNPFVDPSVVFADALPIDEKLLVIFDSDGRGLEEVNSDNFPHMSDRQMGYIHLRDWRWRRENLAKDEFWQSVFAGQVSRGAEGFWVPTKPSPLLKAFMETGGTFGEESKRVDAQLKEEKIADDEVKRLKDLNDIPF